MSRSFRSTFPAGVPVLAMLHLKGDDLDDRLRRARNEIDVLWGHGVDAVIVENYFGGIDDVVAVLDHLDSERPDVVVGLNVLGDDETAFALAAEHDLAFVQLDSVAGHLSPAEDEEFAERLAAARATVDASVLGGVRFKYQPVRSGRTLEEDLALAVDRCDAVVVSGEGTGLVTPLDKITAFRRAVGPDFPVIVGAGVTPANAAHQLRDADGVVVGSALKDTLLDTGDVSPENVARFVAAVRAVR
jgi:predicted TIM-barrel enzyme